LLDLLSKLVILWIADCGYLSADFWKAVHFQIAVPLSEISIPKSLPDFVIQAGEIDMNGTY
jgi:hypothetical protein